MLLTIGKVLELLESGCDPKEIALDLRRGKEMDEAIAAGDAVLMTEQATLLRQCRAALDALLDKKPMLGAMVYTCGAGSNSLGNLRAELYDYRPQGVFGATPDTH